MFLLSLWPISAAALSGDQLNIARRTLSQRSCLARDAAAQANKCHGPDGGLTCFFVTPRASQPRGPKVRQSLLSS